MTGASERKQRRRAGGWRLFFVLNTVALFFLIIAFGREYLGNLQIEQEIRALESQREELEQDQLETLSLIDELSSEYYLEEEARTKHGLGREGETLVVIQSQDQNITSSVDGTMAAEEVTDISNPRRWFYYFFRQDLFMKLAEISES